MKRRLLAFLIVLCMVIGSLNMVVFATEGGEGSGEGSSESSGTGSGEGSGTGSGTGSGEGSGTGSGTGSGEGSGEGSGTGSGTGSGEGSGTGSGTGSGEGSGEGSGTGSGEGSGSGSGSGSGETEPPTDPPVATSGKCGDSMTWSFSGGKLTISGSGAMDDIDDYDNHPWEAWESQVKSIEFGSNIRSISKYVFYGCSNVTSIRFTGPVPGTIESNAFKGITAKVYYPGMDPEWADMEKKNYGGTLDWQPEMSGTGGVFGRKFVWKLEGSTLTIVGKGNMDGWASGSENPPWYSYRNQIKKVVMSGKIYCIYTGAFRDMPNLTEVVWPEDLNIIYSSAFYNCTSLSKLSIPYSVHTIDSYAFYNCSSLRSVSMPSRLKKLGRNVFTNCVSLTSLSLPDSLETIDQKAFAGSSLTEIVIPAKVTKLPTGAFQGCRSLNDVTLKGNVTEIGKDCFESCGKLKKLSLPGSVKSIGESAFADSGLEELVFNGDMPTIGANAFQNTKTSVYYPKNNDTWSDSRIQVLKNTYTKSLTFLAGTPDNATEVTEAPTQAPTVPESTEMATEPVTVPDAQQPTQSVIAPVSPDEVEEETWELPVETVPAETQAPEKAEETSSILDYWPLAAAAVWFFGGSAIAVRLLLIRPRKR